jgi:flavin reductase (DIM6/NTAB) family NADH-FMN oxidoreductase RutF
MPHIEQPIVSSQKSSFAVSFLEEQTVQTAQTLFAAQPHYLFDNWEGRAPSVSAPTFQDAKAWTDCIRFQEILLDQKLLFVAGVEVAKSKGRGEECISQNLRILRAKNGRRTIVLFANSQRKERKGYILIPCEFSHTYGQIVSTR